VSAPDGQAQRRLTTDGSPGTDLTYRAPALSGDGRRFAYVLDSGPVTPRGRVPGREPPLAKAWSGREGPRHDTDTLDSPQTTHFPLARRVAVVTGATSGIGAATARRFAADGAAVAILGRREERLTGLAAELRETTEAGVLRLAADVSDRDAVERAAQSVRDELGRVDLVVAGAGVMLPAPFEEADTAEWDRMLDTNVRGLVATGRAFAADLLAAAAEGGPADLVHVGSIGGHMVFPNYGVYGATKAAVAHLTRNLRAELGPRGVRVMNVEPGLVRTELGDHASDAGIRESLAAWRDEVGPLPPEDVADAIAFALAAPPQTNVAELIVPTAQG
jgi:NADP-dependent 3-hydroxy acid dehydrogenase YdfG